MRLAVSQFTAARQQQRGATLLVILALVLTLGLVGLYMFSTSRMQYKVVGNMQYSELAFSQAEAALVEAETWLASNSQASGLFNASADTPHLYPTSTLTAGTKTMTWSTANAKAAGGGFYLIEALRANTTMVGDSLNVGDAGNSTCNRVNVYRIHSQSSAVKGTTRMLQGEHAQISC